MPKFTNAERVANYAIMEGIEVSAAEVMAKSLLNISLTPEESENAEDIASQMRRVRWQKMELERRAQMHDTRWID